MNDSLLSHLQMHSDTVLERQVELLRQLIGSRTVSTPVPQEVFREEALRAIAITAAALNQMEFGCEIWVTDAGFPVLRARKGSPEDGPQIGFNGHLDVVPIEDPTKWRHDPWGGEIEGSILYGRGACDAKGPVVSMIGALQLLQAAGIAPATSLLLHIVTDEEVAGDCTDACLERGWPDAVIIGEPSSLDVWIAEPGLEQVRVEIEGIATHALNRWRALSDAPGSEAGGVNAIDKAFLVAEAVRKLERQWTQEQRYELLPVGYNTINLGAMIGGKSGEAGEINAAAGPGSVPDLCALEYNIWYYPTQSLDDLKAAFEAMVLAACEHDWWLRQHPPRFIWALRGLTNPPAETDLQHPLAQTLLNATQQVSPAAKATAMQGASLLPWYTRRGIPGVIFGAGNVAQAHGVDEFLDLENLRATTLALALALADDRLKEVPRIEH